MSNCDIENLSIGDIRMGRKVRHICEYVKTEVMEKYLDKMETDGYELVAMSYLRDNVFYVTHKAYIEEKGKKR